MATTEVDRPTMIGWALVLMPLLTMAHEIGGHAAACAAQGGDVAEIGAFYVRCRGLSGAADIAVALAGVVVNVVLAVLAHAAWRRATTDRARLLLWLVWLTQAFVAAGYLAFSGLTGVGDLGLARGGGLAPLGLPRALGLVEAAVGIAAYTLLVTAGIRTLDAMTGGDTAARSARTAITTGYYATAGGAAVVVGLLNPVGLFVTILSAAASTLGGLAGLIPVGRTLRGTPARPFAIRRDLRVLALGIALTAAFALVLGPGLRP